MIASARVKTLVGLIVSAGAAAAAGQITIDGAGYVDRNATGEIVLGGYRGGISIIDHDNDGWMDLVVGARVGEPRRLFRNVSDPNRPGQRTFADVSLGSGLDDADGASRIGSGVVVADYDNDGWSDVFMVANATASGGTHGLLYRNRGDGTFENRSIAAGVRAAGNTAEAACWGDYDLDGDLDLTVLRGGPPVVRLLTNNGDGTFTDETTLRVPTLGASARPYCGAWSDFDGDGWPDFYSLTRNSPGTDILLRNVDDGLGGRTFVNIAVQVGFTNLGPAPMGIAFGDFDGDLDLDLGVSDAAVGTYYERTAAGYVRVTPFNTMFGWGVVWTDAENDGDLDFFTAGSWGEANPDNLQRNDGGTFTDVSTILNGAVLATQHAAQVDFNNDGRADIVTVAPQTAISIYENISQTANNWFSVKLAGDGRFVNRDAANALIYLTAGGVTQVREIVNGSSTTSTEDLRAHFGLGPAQTVDQVEVRWPRRGSLAARTEIFAGPFAANQQVTLSPQIVYGDVNCDGAINFSDIDPFVAALSYPSGAGWSFDCPWLRADANFDDAVNFADIDAFVALLNG